MMTKNQKEYKDMTDVIKIKINEELVMEDQNVSRCLLWNMFLVESFVVRVLTNYEEF